ncbi:MAG: ABC transporter permease [Acidobacteria bacterium]|nr:ABC transporter permease [Acidobacteriota bacterium]
MFKGIWRDLVYAGRSLAKARAFTFVCVVSLGIGMAPVIAIPYGARIFSMPPSGVNTESLVELVTTPAGPRRAANNWSYPDFVDLRAADTGVEIIGWASRASETTTPAAVKPDTVRTMFVSANYFRTIGVALARGSGFDDSAERKRDSAQPQVMKADPVVILGYAFWQNRMASDPDIVGKTLTLDGIPHVVGGIAPELFTGHLGFQGGELFVPLERHPLFMADKNVRSDRKNEWIHIHGRLSPGVGVAQATAAVSAVTSRLAQQYPSTNEFKAGIVEPYYAGGSLERSEFRIIQAVALTLTGTVLLVVCLNISGMVQVRSAMRERELSIRQAIGASRGRLIQYLLAEAILLAGVGGALASLVLFNVPSVMSWLMGEPIPVQLQEALRVDLSMVAICVGLCLATSLVFGLLPAARFSRPVIISSLKDDAGGGGFRVGRVHRLTAALQVAIAVPLLVMGGMTLDRVRATATADLGFESDLLYAVPLKLDSFQIRTVRDNLAKASGVASVTVADGLPLDFRYRMTRVSLQAEANVAPKFVSVHVTRVGDGYLNTMGIPLLRGRGFTVDDRAGAEMVTVISKTLADQLFPNAETAEAATEAIGKRLTFGAADDEDRPQQTLTIVGVTGDFPTSQMSTERPQLLLPLAQHSDVQRNSVRVVADIAGAPHVMVIARSAAGEPPMKMTAALENVVRELDPDFQPASIVTGVWLRQNSMRDFLVQSAVAGISGGVILMLAALGIYGVVGLMVATRTREIAVRVALGASRRRVMSMILFDVVKLVMPGVAVGLILTAALNRLNSENMGIPVSNVESLAYVAGAAIAILVAVLASLAPARRAASVQPMVAMRSV